MKIRFTDTLHQDEPTFFPVQRCDTMRDSRRNVISLTDMMGFDDGRAFKAKGNIAYMSMPVPSDTFVAHKAHSRNPHVRSNGYVLQAVRALARRPKIGRSPVAGRQAGRCRRSPLNRPRKAAYSW
jgi:hypothetical protein